MRCSLSPAVASESLCSPSPSGDSMAFKIVVLAGDGVGPEVVREGVKVLKAVGTAYGLSFDLVPFPCGGQHYLDTDEEWLDDALEACQPPDANLPGAVGLPEAALPNG